MHERCALTTDYTMNMKHLNMGNGRISIDDDFVSISLIIHIVIYNMGFDHTYPHEAINQAVGAKVEVELPLKHMIWIRNCLIRKSETKRNCQV